MHVPHTPCLAILCVGLKATGFYRGVSEGTAIVVCVFARGVINNG